MTPIWYIIHQIGDHVANAAFDKEHFATNEKFLRHLVQKLWLKQWFSCLWRPWPLTFCNMSSILKVAVALVVDILCIVWRNSTKGNQIYSVFTIVAVVHTDTHTHGHTMVVQYPPYSGRRGEVIRIFSKSYPSSFKYMWIWSGFLFSKLDIFNDKKTLLTKSVAIRLKLENFMSQAEILWIK